MATTMHKQESRTGWAVKHGIIGGLIVAVIFAIAEGVGSVLIDGKGFLMPLVAFSSIPLGTPPPQIMPSVGIPVGLIFHLFYTALLAVIGTLIIVNVPALHRTSTITVIAAAVYGTLAWVVGLYIVAPAIGRPWFAQTPPVQQFVYHTFFFGALLGLYIARQLRTAPPA